VVNYRAWKDTARLVGQLRHSIVSRDGLAEILVLDNAPQPEAQLDRVRKPGVRLRRNGRNDGFARAVNAGCELALGSWVLLLNPDTTLPDEFLDRVAELIDELEGQSEIGIVGLGLRNEDGSPQRSTGPFPTLASTLLRLLLPRAGRKYHLTAPTGRTVVDWVTGCGLLVRRPCWEQLGGFDPSFFLYYEDVDLCRRANAAGWSVVHEPTLTATHHRPLHSRPVPAHLRSITRHALLTYARKHWSHWQLRLLAGIITLESRARSWWANWCRRPDEAATFDELQALVAALVAGRTDEAERRLQRIVQQEERDDAAPVGSYSES